MQPASKETGCIESVRGLANAYALAPFLRRLALPTDAVPRIVFSFARRRLFSALSFVGEAVEDFRFLGITTFGKCERKWITFLKSYR
jgi:hypothetical protein